MLPWSWLLQTPASTVRTRYYEGARVVDEAGQMLEILRTDIAEIHGWQRHHPWLVRAFDAAITMNVTFRDEILRVDLDDVRRSVFRAFDDTPGLWEEKYNVEKDLSEVKERLEATTSFHDFIRTLVELDDNLAGSHSEESQTSRRRFI